MADKKTPPPPRPAPTPPSKPGHFNDGSRKSDNNVSFDKPIPPPKPKN